MLVDSFLGAYGVGIKPQADSLSLVLNRKLRRTVHLIE